MRPTAATRRGSLWYVFGRHSLATSPAPASIHAALSSGRCRAAQIAARHARRRSGSELCSAATDIDAIEPGLQAPVSPGSLAGRQSRAAADRDLRDLFHARVAPGEIGSVVPVGGSSLTGLVVAEARAICPAARVEQSEVFTAMVDDLALATGPKADRRG